MSINSAHKSRPLARLQVAGIVALVAFALTGCGSKEPTTSSASSAAPSAGATPAPQGSRVTTGADPDKAPSYPNMYGKPAGSR